MVEDLEEVYSCLHDSLAMIQLHWYTIIEQYLTASMDFFPARLWFPIGDQSESVTWENVRFISWPFCYRSQTYLIICGLWKFRQVGNLSTRQVGFWNFVKNISHIFSCCSLVLKHKGQYPCRSDFSCKHYIRTCALVKFFQDKKKSRRTEKILRMFWYLKFQVFLFLHAIKKNSLMWNYHWSAYLLISNFWGRFYVSTSTCIWVLRWEITEMDEGSSDWVTAVIARVRTYVAPTIFQMFLQYFTVQLPVGSFKFNFHVS